MQPHTVAALARAQPAVLCSVRGRVRRDRDARTPRLTTAFYPICRTRFNVLDLGCGNGRLLAFLDAARLDAAATSGLDSSERLLAEAAAVPLGRVAASRRRSSRPTSLSDDWARPGSRRADPFDAVVSLAVLHHIPGRGKPRHVPGALRRAPAPRRGRSSCQRGSSWRPNDCEDGSRRGRRRGSAVEDLEPGDYLVGWGEGSPGARYCASIEERRFNQHGRRGRSRRCRDLLLRRP